MNSFDRDAELERRQIREISLNVARRLLDVLERPRISPPAGRAEIEGGARVIADIQREIDNIMSRWPEGQLLDIPVLTHVLESHSRALSLIEDLEAKAGEAPRPPESRPDPARTHAALIATAREIEREASYYEPKYEPQPSPERRASFTQDAQPYAKLPFAPEMRTMPQQAAPVLWPQQGAVQPARLAQPSRHNDLPPRHLDDHPPRPVHDQPRHHVQAPPQTQVSLPPARTMRTAGSPAAPSQLQPPRTRGGPPQRQPQPLAPPNEPPGETSTLSRVSKIRTLAFTPIGATALVAGIAILAASFAGALSFALSTDDGPTRIAAQQTPGGKFDGRLSHADAVPTSGSDILVVSPPENTGNLAQPYLVVIATRRSTEELEQDFRHFKETHPTLLGSARGRVDSVQSQDGKTWYRLSLIPPRSQSDAAELCEELKSAGLTECWIKPLPIGQSSG